MPDGIVADNEVQSTHWVRGDNFAVVTFGDGLEIHVPADPETGGLNLRAFRGLATAKRVRVLARQEEALLGPARDKP